MFVVLPSLKGDWGTLLLAHKHSKYSGFKEGQNQRQQTNRCRDTCCPVASFFVKISVMDFVNELKERGLIELASADPEKILGEKRIVYIGTDPTADSLHVGHLAWMILLRRLSDAGHKIVLLVGGGTGMIGDPKEKGERSLVSEDVIDSNAKALSAQLAGLLGTQADFLMVNNAEWLREVKLLAFLRDVGKHFTVNDLIKRDLIKRRLASPDDSISYTEFTYALLQGHDYWELNQRHGVDLQIGGTDQWTNILSGVDLIRKREGKEVFALSFPLITDASGKKFGKSEGNAVWLSAEKTSPYQFYQFWLNVDDQKVIDYLKIYTFLPLTEIREVATLHQNNPNLRTAQRRLAEEVTRMVHGEGAPALVSRVSEILFAEEDIANLSAEEKDLLSTNAPKYVVPAGESLADTLVSSGLASSKRAAREFISNGAVTIKGEKLTDPETVLDFTDLVILKRGKKNAVLLVRN